MTDRLANFFLFWRNFILGDDWVTAAAIMWALLALYSFFIRGIQIPYLMVVAVTIALILSLWRSLQGHENLKGLTSRFVIPLVPTQILWLLMISIAVIPYCLFFINNSLYGFSLAAVILPEVLACGLITALVLVLSRLQTKYPATTSLLAGIATLVIIQGLYNYEVGVISRSSPYVGFVVIPHNGWTGLVIVLLFLGICTLLPILYTAGQKPKELHRPES